MFLSLLAVSSLLEDLGKPRARLAVNPFERVRIIAVVIIGLAGLALLTCTELVSSLVAYCSVLTREGAGGAGSVPVAIGASRIGFRNHAADEGPVALRTLEAALRILPFVTVQVTQHSIAVLSACKVESVGGILERFVARLDANPKLADGLVRVST